MTRPQRYLRLPQRNELLTEIVEFELDAAEFRWGDGRLVAGDIIEALEHDPSGFYFAIGVARDGSYYYGECEPGHDRPIDRIGGKAWSEVKTAFRQWLMDIEQDLTATDDWADLQESQGDLASALRTSGSVDTPLTEEERARVAEYLDSLRELITSRQELTAEQLELLDERLESFERASHRLTRKDFLNYLIGGVVTLGIELALKAPLLNDAVRSTITALTGILSGLPELPGPL